MNLDVYGRSFIDLLLEQERLNNIAFDTEKNKFCMCNSILCFNCAFKGRETCDENKKRWLFEEYVSPEKKLWSKVEKNTRVFVKIDGKEIPKYFAYYIPQSGKIAVYRNGDSFTASYTSYSVDLYDASIVRLAKEGENYYND